MTAAPPMTFNDYALAFLSSEFAGEVYIDWPIERRLERFLRHQGRGDLADSGEDFDALLDCVMVNFVRARRSGLLDR